MGSASLALFKGAGFDFRFLRRLAYPPKQFCESYRLRFPQESFLSCNFFRTSPHCSNIVTIQYIVTIVNSNAIMGCDSPGSPSFMQSALREAPPLKLPRCPRPSWPSTRTLEPAQRKIFRCKLSTDDCELVSPPNSNHSRTSRRFARNPNSSRTYADPREWGVHFCRRTRTQVHGAGKSQVITSTVFNQRMSAHRHSPHFAISQITEHETRDTAHESRLTLFCYSMERSTPRLPRRTHRAISLRKVVHS